MGNSSLGEDKDEESASLLRMRAKPNRPVSAEFSLIPERRDISGLDKAYSLELPPLTLLVHCDNFRRLLSIFGVAGFIARCRQRQAAPQAGGGGSSLGARLAACGRRLWALLTPLWPPGGPLPALIRRSAARHASPPQRPNAPRLRARAAC